MLAKILFCARVSPEQKEISFKRREGNQKIDGSRTDLPDPDILLALDSHKSLDLLLLYMSETTSHSAFQIPASELTY